MAINKYTYRKPLKIDWLKNIPDHWKEVRLGSLFNQRKEKVSDTDYPPLSVTKNGVLPQLENAAKSNDGDNRKLVLKGDFAINSRSDRKGSSGVSIYDGSVSLIYIVLEPVSIEPRYSEYLLKSHYFKEEYYRYGRGIVEDLWTTRYSEMKNMIIPSATKSEQTAIANFLDYKLEKIDRFISKKKQLIELLNEQKAAIINQAVTKGLNPNAKMKPSGIEWLGDIPESWRVWKFKFFTKILSGYSPEQVSFIATGVDYFKVEQLNNVDDNYRLNNSFWNVQSTSINKIHPSNILLIPKRGGAIGTNKIAISTNECVFDTNVMGLKFVKTIVDIDFIALWIKNRNLIEIADITTIPQINNKHINPLQIGLPSLIEQKEIVDFIKIETIKIEKTITTIEKEIDLVEEYKIALIAEAVTGKIDVRVFEIPQTEMPLAMVAEEAVNYYKKN